MKLLFSHDIKLINCKGKHYFDASYSIGVFNRYFKYFDEITFFSRTIYKDDVEQKLTPMEDERISFEGIDSYKDLLSRQSIQLIKKLVDDSDVVIIRLPSTLGIFVEKYAKKAGKMIIFEVVACAFDTLWYYSWKGKIIAPIFYLLLRFQLNRALNTIYVTEKFLQKKYPSKGAFIGCSDVDLGIIDDAVLERRIDKINNKSKSDKMILGTIGAVYVKYKGHRFVLEAMARLIKKGYHLEYQLVGAGSSEKLTRLIKKLGLTDCVVFKGSLKHEDVFKWLDSIDIYIQPSETEGLPRSIIEALSRACPIIGTDTGGIPELIESSCSFKKRSVDDLERIMTEMLNGSLVDRAVTNFNRAKDFDKEILDRKRDKFYKEIFEKEGLFLHE